MSSRNRSDDQMKCVYMGPPMRRNLLDSLKERLAGNKPKKSYPGSFADGRDPDDGPGTADVHAGPGPDPEEPELEEVYMGPPLEEGPDGPSDAGKGGSRRKRKRRLIPGSRKAFTRDLRSRRWRRSTPDLR